MPITRQPYFLPTQISNCSLWLDAADTSTDSMILSGSNVSTWKDKSGTGNNATANTGTVTTNSTRINGLNTIRFNASSFLNIASFTITANISAFAVLRGVTAQETGPKGYFFLGNGAQPSFFVYTLPPANGNLAGPFSGWVATTGETNWYMPSSDFFLNNPGFIYTDNNSSFVNGSQLTFNPNRASVPNAVSAGTYGIQVGGRVQADSLAFDFAECIFYNRTITAAQRQQVEAYLAQKWGLTGSLPAGHPGLTSLLYRVQQPFLGKIPYFTRFSPRQISGCSLWLDGADPAGNGVIPEIGTSIATWADKSGLSQTITQANSGNQAVYSSGGGLTFTSGKQYPLNTSVFMTMFSVAYTIFIVEKRALSGTFFIIGNTAGGGGPLYIGYQSTTAMRFSTASVIDMDYSIPAYSGSDATEPIRIWAFRWFGSAANLRDIGLNGQLSPQTQAFNQAPSFSGNQSIGGSAYGNYVGKIYEMIIFNKAISNSEKQQVESYLAQKWGLISSLPAAHLNATFPAGSPAAIQPFVSRIRPALTNIAKATGGIITNIGGRRFHTFINNGTFSIVSAMPGKTFEVFAIGGGGGGGGFEGGGGGGGGLVTYTSSLSVGNFSITIGTGGTGGTASSVAGGNGTSTLFSSLVTAIGGGGGGSSFGGGPANGGCGGGGAYDQSYGTGSQGFNGAVASPSLFWGGGGGGTSASATNNNGGAGTLYYGSYYGGGGGGGGNQGPNGTGGIGGGGDGGGSGTPSAQYITPAPIAGAANTGGGGGGHGYNGTTGAIGGKGICIVSYIYP
jgi:hypothetical protein